MATMPVLSCGISVPSNAASPTATQGHGLHFDSWRERFESCDWVQPTSRQGRQAACIEIQWLQMQYRASKGDGMDSSFQQSTTNYLGSEVLAKTKAGKVTSLFPLRGELSCSFK